VRPDSGANSVSRVALTLELKNKGMLECQLIRHLAPLTVNKIMKSLPVQDRVHVFGDKFVYLETRLEIGAEKQKTQFRRGDISFMTSNASICFFVKDCIASPMNHIGIVKQDVKLIDATETGDIMILKKE
jgi:hypothetical protein